MIYEKLIQYLEKCEAEKSAPAMSPVEQMLLMRAFRSILEVNRRFRGLQLEKSAWRSGIHKRCNRDHYEWALRRKREIVCVCGSTRFKESWEKAVLEETLAGRVVLSVGGFMHHDGLVITDEQKIALDALHFHKIDLAAGILVINEDNYIGYSTLNEIRYAQARGKTIRFYFPLSRELGEMLGIPA